MGSARQPGSRVEIGRRLRLLRRALVISAERLADACGVSPAVVWGWERGARSPDATQLAAIVELTGVDPAWLLLGRQAMGGLVPREGRRTARYSQAARDILEVLRAHPTISMPDLARQSGWAHNTVCKWVRLLEGQGIIRAYRQVGRGHRTRYEILRDL